MDVVKASPREQARRLYRPLEVILAQGSFSLEFLGDKLAVIGVAALDDSGNQLNVVISEDNLAFSDAYLNQFRQVHRVLEHPQHPDHLRDGPGWHDDRNWLLDLLIPVASERNYPFRQPIAVGRGQDERPAALV